MHLPNKFIFIFVILPAIQFISAKFRVIVRDQLHPPHNKVATQKINSLKSQFPEIQVFRLSRYQKPSNHPSYWIYTPVLKSLSVNCPKWTLFIEPNTILNPDFFEKIKLPDSDSPVIVTNKLVDQDLSIIHHFAGYKPEEVHKKSFIDFSRGFLANDVMIKKLANAKTSQNGQSFHIDAGHEFSEHIDKVLESKRDWLIHSEIFENIKLEKNICDSLQKSISDDDYLVGVKTAQKFHQ